MTVFRVISVTKDSAFDVGTAYRLSPGQSRLNSYALTSIVHATDTHATVVGQCILQRVDTIGTTPTLPEAFVKGVAETLVPATVNHGGKDEAGKSDPTMLYVGCANALNAVQQVLEGGAKKYAANSWQQVPDGINKYYKAFSRHKVEVDLHGLEAVNPDFGLLHIDHMITDLLFIRELIHKQNKG